MRTVITLIAVFSVSSLALAGTNQWPEFRGPQGNGQAPDAQLPESIGPESVKWSTAIHGKGWSSPVVWGDQIWLTTATEDGTRMSVVCVDRKSGDVLRDMVVKENDEPAFCHAMNSYATPTPVIEQDRLYVHFGSYLTACIDTTSGEMIWKREDLACDHHRGPASSPILYDGKVFVAYDGFDVQYVVAFDKQTGDTVWKKDRDIDYGTDNGDQKKAYGTAQIITVNGQPQLIYPSAGATIAYDPADGREIWRVQHGGMNASARPVYGAGLLFITNGMGSIVAVKPSGTGDVTGTHIAWSDHKLVAKKSSPLLVDGLLYMVSDEGVVSCREPETGEIIWKERCGGEFAASPLYASGRIYLFSRDGTIITLATGGEYKLLAETQLGDGFMASPAIVGNQMYLRSKSQLFCIE